MRAFKGQSKDLTCNENLQRSQIFLMLIHMNCAWGPVHNNRKSYHGIFHATAKNKL
jgi:hypothetical protein